MRIEFEKLRYKNILSTGNVWTEISLNSHAMTLVVGVNGAGKSTMLDALCLVLFNKPFRTIKKDNLINSINGKDALCELEFSKGSVKYLVRRGIKPDLFEIYQNGVLISQDGARGDYQKYLENTILGFNLKSFTQIVIVGSTSFVSFMKLKTWERRIIIEDLLDIGIFSTMNRVLKEKLKNVNESVQSTRANIQTIMDKIDMQKKYIGESKKSAEMQLEAKKVDLEYNKILIQNMASNVDSIQTEITNLQTNVSDHKNVIGVANRLEEYRIKIDSNIKQIDKDILFYQTNDICPKCQQQLLGKDTHIANCSQERTKYSSGLQDLESKQTEIQLRLAEINKILSEINNKQFEITKLTISIGEAQKTTAKLLTEIADLTNKKPISEDILQLSRDLYSDLERLNADKRDLLERKAYFELAAMLLQDNGIKAKIIKQYLPIINKMVNKYLTSLEFFVNFNIDEEFNETIKSRHRDLFVYDNFSEGEKLRIDIALLFTWRAVAKIKNSINTNLLIMDEILDGSLDANGMDEFMKLLNAFGNEANVLLISHKGDVLADKFNHVLQFEKNGNFSELKS